MTTIQAQVGLNFICFDCLYMQSYLFLFVLQPHPSMLSLSQLPHLQNLHSHAQHPQHHAQMHPGNISSHEVKLLYYCIRLCTIVDFNHVSCLFVGMALNDSMNQIDTLALQMEHHQSFENSNFGPSQQVI